MKRNWLLLILTLALVSSLFAGCSAKQPPATSGTFPLTVVDSYQRSVTVKTLPKRIVSLAPSNTEILFALGLDQQVIGVTDICDYPAQTANTKKVGPYAQPNLEQVIAAKPDLILADSLTGKDAVDQLTNAGIAVLAIRSDGLDQLWANIALVGKATGSSKQAETLVAGLKARLKVVQDKVQSIPAEKRPSVFYEVWPDELMSCGPNTFLTAIINAAGGRSVTANATTDWPKINLEDLIASNPQVIILGHVGQSPAQALGRASWKTIDAIKNKRVYALDPNIWSRPGPRVIDAVEELARILYPDLFSK